MKIGPLREWMTSRELLSLLEIIKFCSVALVDKLKKLSDMLVIVYLIVQRN